MILFQQKFSSFFVFGRAGCLNSWVTLWFFLVLLAQLGRLEPGSNVPLDLQKEVGVIGPPWENMRRWMPPSEEI